MSNFKEWISETVPTNAASVFKLLSATNSGSGVVVTWLSATSMAYCIERTTNLSIPSSFVTLATNLWSYSATRSYTDTTATNSQAYFYRVRIQQ